MITKAFSDELCKLASDFRLGTMVLGSRQPQNAIGVLLGKLMPKLAQSLQEMHYQPTPPDNTHNPQEAESRLPMFGVTKPQITAGKLGLISPALHPIDQERHNRWWYK